jgi:hypothetical protein
MAKRVETYAGLLNIPEAKVGEFEIRHMVEPAGKLMPCTSFRTSMYGGHKAKSVVYDHPTTWHELLEDGGRWTSDLPIEQYQQRQSLRGFRGKVLVGGLGLGVVVQMLKRLRSVTEITVIEKSKEVLELVAPYVSDKRVSFHHCDLHEFLSQCATVERTFHHAFFDIWTSDGEGEFYETIIPLRLASKGVVTGKVRCWNEDVMRGQVQNGLFTKLQLMHYDTLSEGVVLPDGKPVAKLATLSNGEPVTLDWLASTQDHEWHDRVAPFYRTVLDAKPDP